MTFKFSKNLFYIALSEFARLTKFAYIAGSGLILDVAIYHILTHYFWTKIGLIWGYAAISNIISAFTAVTFVYFTSSRYLFSKYVFSIKKYCIWLIYQALSIALASYCIELLVRHLTIDETICKLITVPFTFITNYIFIAFLIRYRGRIKNA